MTWARHEAGLTLRNATFRDQVATLAAAIREIPKEDMVSKDISQQRRTRRIVRAVIAVVTVLVLAISWLVIFANGKSMQAIHETDVKVSNELVGQSELVSDTDPTLSRLASVAAWRINQSPNARYAMLAAAARPDTAVLSPTGWLLAFSPDGKTLATGSVNGTVRLWDVATHQPIGNLTSGPASRASPLWSLAFSPDDTTVAAGLTRVVQLWDAQTRQPIGNLPATGLLRSVAFGPHGTILAGGSDDRTLRLWDVATRKQIWNTNVRAQVESMAFSREGTLAIGTDGGAVQLWDVAGRHMIVNLTGSTGVINSVAFSPSGSVLASGGADGTIRLWDVATGKQTGNPITIPTPVESVAFSPDGKTLASGGDDHAVRLWDVATRKPIGNLNAQAPVRSVAFSKTGTLAASTDDGTVQLWDVAARHMTADLTSPGGVIYSAAFSPDGTTLATSSSQGTLQLWDATTGQQIGSPFQVPVGAVYSVAFSPDGKTLASGDADHTVRLWDVSYLVDVIQNLCASAGRSLTRSEWARYAPGVAYQQVCP